MSTTAPDIFDSAKTAQLLDEWLGAVHDYAVEHLVVLGPDVFGPPDARCVLAAHPLDAHEAATVLAQSSEYGGSWQRTESSLVAWQRLDHARPENDEEPEWHRAWRERGARTVVRVGFPLPGSRAFECYLFSRRKLNARAEAAALTWSTLNIWPTLRAALGMSQALLTAREVRCLALAFDGHTARASAERMDCTERTVNFHLSNAMAKLRVDNKIAAIQRACWLGVL